MTNYTVTKKEKGLLLFTDDYQANRFYTVLKDRMRTQKISLVDVDRLLMEIYGSKYLCGEFKPTFRDWSQYIKPERMILRVYSPSYATIYFEGVGDEEETIPTIEDFEKALSKHVSDFITKYAVDNPKFDTDLLDRSYIMLKIRGLEASKAIVLSEVK